VVFGISAAVVVFHFTERDGSIYVKRWLVSKGRGHIKRYRSLKDC